MRYYSITITTPGGALVRPAPLAPLGLPATYTSLGPGGQTLTNALNVELDLSVVPYATPLSAGLVRVWGISLPEIAQASNLNGFEIKVYGGMAKGLPLANPAQAGLLVQGQVFQAFGNWIGTDQTLDLIIRPSTGEIDNPKNIILNWKAGTKLSEAIAVTLLTAFPDYQIDINISPRLVLSHDQVGYYQNVTQLAALIKNLSADIVGGSYTGVEVILSEKKFKVYDQTTPARPKLIAFQDMIGQPTWIAPGTIQVKCIMRADISVADYIKLPPVLVTTSAQSFSQYRSQSAFQGSFLVNEVRHVGNFRQRDAASWATVINGVQLVNG